MISITKLRVACLARIILPGVRHHVTRRGNRRQTLFVEPDDYALYGDLLAERCKASGVARKNNLAIDILSP